VSVTLVYCVDCSIGRRSICEVIQGALRGSTGQAEPNHRGTRSNARGPHRGTDHTRPSVPSPSPPQTTTALKGRVCLTTPSQEPTPQDLGGCSFRDLRLARGEISGGGEYAKASGGSSAATVLDASIVTVTVTECDCVGAHTRNPRTSPNTVGSSKGTTSRAQRLLRMSSITASMNGILTAHHPQYNARSSCRCRTPRSTHISLARGLMRSSCTMLIFLS
jgi:hypothetical protein